MAYEKNEKFYPDGNTYEVVMLDPPQYGRPGRQGKKGEYWICEVEVQGKKHVWFPERNEMNALSGAGSPMRGSKLEISGRGANFSVRQLSAPAAGAVAGPSYSGGSVNIPTLGDIAKALHRTYHLFVGGHIPSEQASMLASNCINNAISRGSFDLNSLPQSLVDTDDNTPF